ncbi:uncharacterized protein LOC124328565 isoform X2 [Daphnia pulicaria]|uniref:uncharacterized protein LOC124328565 isoform X2 n=1 Tax=Daphnia pulicaria TaxID=35523 RepID=UPI001EEA40E5|nr:uncharacterized protein LOC124328565 isoform X2 [Daphnia pulicaria]
MAEQRDSVDATIAPLQGEVEALPLGTLVPPKITNANRPIHGSLFQFKLTEIALIRGIGGGFPFHLGTEIQEFGKFDDLVFKYQVTTGDQRQQWRYKFVQAKHKLDEGNSPPQILKSQSLIPFPRVGRSRSSFIANAVGSARSGGAGNPMMMSSRSNANVKSPNNWMMLMFLYYAQKKNNADIKRHLIPFPRVGKRQNLIPFPRVGRAGYYQPGFFPSTDDEESQASIQQQFALSSEESQASAPSSFLLSGSDILGALNNGRSNSDERTAVFIPRRWMTNSQESEE